MSETKHVNFFALEKACQKAGCPFCNLINERIYRYIDGMLFEHISDIPFRRAYRASGGFCDEHGKILLDYRDGLAVAILGQNILSDYIAAFKNNKTPKFKAKCPACIEKKKIEKDFSSFLTENHKDKETQEQIIAYFTASDGLCVPHYAKLLRFFKPPFWLKKFQEQKFESLNERVLRFIDYSAWGNQEKFESLSREDQIVWQEVAIMLRGMID